MTPDFLISVYNKLFETFGPQHWWPGDSPLEISLGAILTQNTNWTNVEKAIINLKKEDVLAVDAILNLTDHELECLIRPAGFYRQKAKRLKAFLTFLQKNYMGNFSNTAPVPTHTLREQLLKINGIGPETADSIILYAMERPVFVIDAYTKRFLSRHNIIDEKTSYDQIQTLFHKNLPFDSPLFNEFHALIVKLGKIHCKTKPICHNCPLF
jgi:endonuclease-3 related protein